MTLRLKLNSTMLQAFTVIIVVMWVLSFLMDLANPKYDPPAYVNPLILSLGAYLFAKASNGKNGKNGNGNKETK